MTYETSIANLVSSEDSRLVPLEVPLWPPDFDIWDPRMSDRKTQSMGWSLRWQKFPEPQQLEIDEVTSDSNKAVYLVQAWRVVGCHCDIKNLPCKNLDKVPIPNIKISVLTKNLQHSSKGGRLWLVETARQYLQRRLCKIWPRGTPLQADNSKFE